MTAFNNADLYGHLETCYGTAVARNITDIIEAYDDRGHCIIRCLALVQVHEVCIEARKSLKLHFRELRAWRRLKTILEYSANPVEDKTNQIFKWLEEDLALAIGEISSDLKDLELQKRDGEIWDQNSIFQALGIKNVSERLATLEFRCEEERCLAKRHWRDYLIMRCAYNKSIGREINESVYDDLLSRAYKESDLSAVDQKSEGERN